MAGLRNIFSRLGNWTREHTSEAVLYCCSVIAVFSFLGTRALFGSENRWAEAVREMLLTGDIFHPCLNGVVYFDKPIMSYWLIYLATRATGVLNEWIVRLPSAVFAVLAVWCTVRLFSMLFDRRTGVLSGWFLLASWGFLWWGRSAEADMENMAFILFAFTWFIHCRERANFFHYLVFYLLIFVGALFKGLPAVAVPLALVAVFTLGDGWAGVRRQLKFANFAALLVGGGCYFLTLYISGIIPLAAGCRYPQELSALDLVWRENVVRVFSAFDHRNPPWLYLYEIHRVFAPWSAFYVASAVWIIATWRRAEKNARLTLIGSLLIFAMFTASGSRRWYYILPIAPYCMGLAALFLTRFADHPWLVRIFGCLRYVIIAAASVAVITLVGWEVWSAVLGFDLPVLIKLAIPLVGLLALAALGMEEVNRAKLAEFSGLPESAAGVLAALIIAMVGILAFIVPAGEEFRTYKKFLSDHRYLGEEIAPERVLFYSHEADCNVLFYWKPTQPMRVIGMNGTEEENARLEGMDKKEKRKVAAEYTRRSYGELREAIRELAMTSDEPIVVVSKSGNMERLDKLGVPDFPEFDRRNPDYAEPQLKIQNQSDNKYCIWVLDPERLRKLYDDLQE